MVLDPFSALSLATNVVQFVQFGSHLISEAGELYHSATGSSVGNAELKKIYDQLDQLSARLAASSSTDTFNITQRSPAENELRKIAASCQETCKELLDLVRDLSIGHGARGWWRSFQQASRSAWKKKDIDALQKRLDEYRSSLTVHLAEIIR